MRLSRGEGHALLQGTLPEGRIEPEPPALAGPFFTTEPLGKPLIWGEVLPSAKMTLTGAPCFRQGDRQHEARLPVSFLEAMALNLNYFNFQKMTYAVVWLKPNETQVNSNSELANTSRIWL